MTEGRPSMTGRPSGFRPNRLPCQAQAYAGSLTPPVERVFWESQRPLAFIR